MIDSPQGKFVRWFIKTYHWWFSSLYGRLALLFAVSAFVLVFLTYIFLSFEFFYKDTILDAHDAYHHAKMVEGWKFNLGDSSQNTHMYDELNNLHLFCQVYHLSDSIEAEHMGPIWHNLEQEDYQLNLWDYQSYNDNEIIQEELSANNIRPVSINGYVSFGQIEMPLEYGTSFLGNKLLLEASVVEDDLYKYLIVVTNYDAPNEFIAFIPIVLLTLVFMFLLYLRIRFFLSPIDVMKNRIAGLEKGDLNSTIKISGKDELAILSNKFNDLVSQVKSLLEQKERLLSEVSHELRTPLAKMKLLLELKPSNKNKEKINNQIEYLNSLITNILIADKMSAPYSELDLETVSIQGLINRSTEFAKSSSVEFHINSNPLVRVDVVKLSIVIKNIIDNAHKYAPGDSPLIIRSEEDQTNIKLLFIDSGPGIEPELLDTIIKPFVQGTGNRKKGFGLGLAICKKVLDAHGGSFLIENNIDRGCTFTVVLPILNNAKG